MILPCDTDDVRLLRTARDRHSSSASRGSTSSSSVAASAIELMWLAVPPGSDWGDIANAAVIRLASKTSYGSSQPDDDGSSRRNQKVTYSPMRFSAALCNKAMKLLRDGNNSAGIPVDASHKAFRLRRTSSEDWK